MVNCCGFWWLNDTGGCQLGFSNLLWIAATIGDAKASDFSGISLRIGDNKEGDGQKKGRRNKISDSDSHCAIDTKHQF